MARLRWGTLADGETSEAHDVASPWFLLFILILRRRWESSMLTVMREVPPGLGWSSQPGLFRRRRAFLFCKMFPRPQWLYGSQQMWRMQSELCTLRIRHSVCWLLQAGKHRSRTDLLSLGLGFCWILMERLFQMQSVSQMSSLLAVYAVGNPFTLVLTGGVRPHAENSG